MVDLLERKDFLIIIHRFVINVVVDMQSETVQHFIRGAIHVDKKVTLRHQSFVEVTQQLMHVAR